MKERTEAMKHMSLLTRIKRLEQQNRDAGKNERRREILGKMFDYLDRGEIPEEKFFTKNRLEPLRQLFY